MSAFKKFDSGDSTNDGKKYSCSANNKELNSGTLVWRWGKGVSSINSPASDSGVVGMSLNDKCEVILTDIKIPLTGGVWKSVGALTALAAANYYLF